MKIAKRIISVLVSLTLLAGMLLLLLTDKKTFSENENRMLAEFPSFSLSSLRDGDYTAELEEYIKDHFPMRDALMKLKTRVQLAVGYRIIDGVYVGKDRLFQKVDPPDGSRLTDSAAKLFSAIEKNEHLRTSVILIPSAAEIYPEELPMHPPLVDETETIAGILDAIDCDIGINGALVLSAHKDDGENLFYKTDHHYTTYAALCVFNAFCEAAKMDAPEKDAYEKIILSDCFRGTLYSTVLDDRRYDEIARYDLVPGVPELLSCRRGSARGELVDCPYFDESYLDKKDKYAYFGGGNDALMVVSSQFSLSENEIVVIKDSFANCFVPFLARFYRTIHVIDPRYFKGRKISDYINEVSAGGHLSDVLILYGINSLNDNTGVSTLA